MNNWTEQFFNKMYWELFMKRTPEEIQKETNIILKLINTENTNNLLDVCCGVGDIAHNLEKHLNIQATGIEYSPDYIKESFINNIIQGDACVMQTSEQFDLVLNWYSSFAYFSPEKNKQLLTNCYHYCNGIFLLESYNPYAVIHGFKDKFEYEKNYNGEIYHIERICHIDINSRMLCQKWIFSSNGNNFHYDTQSYLYFPDEIKNVLSDIGFKNIQVMGRNNEEIEELTHSSPRLIIKAEK